MSLKKEFWHFLIQGKLDDDTGAFANYYCYGDHLGESYFKAEQIARDEGFDSPALMEAQRLDTIKGFELPEGAVNVTSDSYMLPSLNTYPIIEDDVEFIPPIGVAFGTDDGDYDRELIKEAYVAYNKDDDGVFELELVVDNSRLTPTFFDAIDFLPDVDGFWIYLLDHWNNSTTEIWAGGHIVSKENAKQFLIENEDSTLKNGFVDIVVHCKEGETNLTLSEHKKVQLHTKSESMFQNFIDNIIDLGFEQTRDYYSIEHGYYHWHYRPMGSLNRADFTDLLRGRGFEKIEN